MTTAEKQGKLPSVAKQCKTKSMKCSINPLLQIVRRIQDEHQAKSRLIETDHMKSRGNKIVKSIQISAPVNYMMMLVTRNLMGITTIHPRRKYQGITTGQAQHLINQTER